MEVWHFLGGRYQPRNGETPPGRKGVFNAQPHIFQQHEALCNDDKMSSITRMSPLDLLDLNLTNLDPLTENYDLGFYLNYLTKWPSLFSSVKDRDAGVVGYSMDFPQNSPSM